MEGFLFIAVPVLIFLTWFWWQYRHLCRQSPTEHLPKPLETLFVRIDCTPDAPVSFGYKMAWLAIKTETPERVLDLLDIQNVQPANWQTGITAAYNGHTFISPPVSGWVFVVTRKLPEPGGHSDCEWGVLLRRLSERLGEVQYFGTHRVVEYHAWARFIEGAEVRTFAFLGERAEVLADRGEKSAGECELGYDYFVTNAPEAESDSYWEREDLCFPTEDHVMEVAGKWSINPDTLEDLGLPLSAGWIGTLIRH